MNENRRDKPFIRSFAIAPAGKMGAINRCSDIHYAEYSLPRNYRLWVDSDEQIVSARSDACGIYIIGKAFNSDAPIDSALDIAQKLADCQDNDSRFNSMLSVIAGRFAIIREIRSDKLYIYHDTSGCRTVYYNRDEGIVTSHYYLARSFLPDDSARGEAPNTKYIADLTANAGIFTLLPNFRLELYSMQYERYFPLTENEFTTWTEEERLDEISRLWHNSVDALFTSSDKIAVSITGGADSRLTLSFLRKYWGRIHSFTYGIEHRRSNSQYSKVMSNDFSIVHQLAEMLNLPRHIFIDLSTISPLSDRTSALLSLNTTTRHGPQLVEAYRKSFVGDGWVHIRSTAIEVMRGYWGKLRPKKGYLRY